MRVLIEPIQLKPDYAEAYSNRGSALQELKQSDAALASYDRAIQLQPDYAEACYNRGNALRELRQLDAALASYDRAIQLQPDYAEAHTNRGNALQELKQWDAAPSITTARSSSSLTIYRPTTTAAYAVCC